MIWHSRQTGQLLPLLLIAIAGVLLSWHSIAAHGIDRTPQQTNVPVGGYRLSVWTGPGILRPGEIHVIAQVTDATQAPIVRHLVQVQAQHEELATAPAVTLAQPVDRQTAIRSGLTHEAVLRLVVPGHYDVCVALLDERGSAGRTCFKARVAALPSAVTSILNAMVVASLAVSFWLVKLGISLWRKTSYAA